LRKFQNQSINQAWSAFQPSKKAMSLEQLAIIHDKMGLDPEVQRLGGVNNGSGWTKKKSREYLDSLFRGYTGNSIILVHLPSVKYYAKQAYDDGNISKELYEETIKYCKEWMEVDGCDWVVLDGNNTCSTATAYLRNQLAIYNDNGVLTFFKDEPEDVQMVRRHQTTIDVVELRDINRQDMGEVFKRLNKSTQLERQELRQPISTDLAIMIRKLSNNNGLRRPMKGGPFAKLVYSATEIDKREHEQELAYHAFRLHNNDTKNCNHDSLDEMYETVFALSKKNKTTLTSVIKTCDKIAVAIEKWEKTQEEGISYRKIGKPESRAIFVATLAALELNYNVPKGKELEFVGWVLKSHTHFANQSASQRFDDNELNKFGYHKWMKGFQNAVKYQRIKWLWTVALKAAIENDGIAKRTSGFLSKKRTKKDFFTWAQKRMFAEKQGWKFRDDSDICVLSLYLGKYDGGHLESFINGGDTSDANGELQPQDQRGGDNTANLQPHFPFQEMVPPEDDVEVEAGAA
jgi:hypothetical protein